VEVNPIKRGVLSRMGPVFGPCDRQSDNFPSSRAVRILHLAVCPSVVMLSTGVMRLVNRRRGKGVMTKVEGGGASPPR